VIIYAIFSLFWLAIWHLAPNLLHIFGHLFGRTPSGNRKVKEAEATAPKMRQTFYTPAYFIASGISNAEP